MNAKRLVAIGFTFTLLALVAAACAPTKAADPCPTSAPLSCPTVQSQSCPTAPACPTVAAAQVPTNPTLTFNAAINQCAYSGPETFPYGKFTLDIEAGQIPKGYEIGFAMATLKEGKTFADLLAYLPVEPPDWINVLASRGPFTQNITNTYDLSAMGNYTKGEPIYLVCFSGVADLPIKIGTIGPFEVK